MSDFKPTSSIIKVLNSTNIEQSLFEVTQKNAHLLENMAESVELITNNEIRYEGPNMIVDSLCFEFTETNDRAITRSVHQMKNNGSLFFDILMIEPSVDGQSVRDAVLINNLSLHEVRIPPYMKNGDVNFSTIDSVILFFRNRTNDTICQVNQFVDELANRVFKEIKESRESL